MLKSILFAKILAKARVASVEILGERFRLIDLVSEGFVDATFEPGAKMKIDAGDWAMRTYTPVDLDPVTGRVRLLAFVHGRGPGSRWAASVAPGDRTHTGGPKRSLDLGSLSSSAVFFGDETSFAAARTIQGELAPDALHCVFEVSSAGEAEAVTERLALRNPVFIVRMPQATHLGRVARKISELLDPLAAPDLILTGNGRSIQTVRSNIRTLDGGISADRIKAYWSPGKTALD